MSEEVKITPKEIAKAIDDLLDENERLSNWWKQTNVILRNEKSLMVNDEALIYISELEEKIDKAKEYIDELEEIIDKAKEYINNHTIEWVDKKFEKHNVMVKFNEYANPQALLEILGDKE